MKLLAIDTATEACSAALMVDGEVREHYQRAPRAHAEFILPMVDALLAEAGLKLAALDALAFGRGPGTFTGVRVASATVQGLALGAGLPVVAVSDLAALAQGAWREHRWKHVLACLDARMREVYFGAFEMGDDGLMSAAGVERVAPPAALTWSAGHGWCGVGPGWTAYTALTERTAAEGMDVDSLALPRARDIAMLAERGWRAGEAVQAAQALPVYLRETVATPHRKMDA
jgi:tRNA threonylcarbamoyladenosine biosynthesis protein TsaB